MKKTVSSEEVSYIANLAKLPLSDHEKKQLQGELSEVIDFNMNLLEEVETDKVEPTAHVGGIAGRLRRDETQPGFSQVEALQNAKETHNGFFKVKAVLEQDDE